MIGRNIIIVCLTLLAIAHADSLARAESSGTNTKFINIGQLSSQSAFLQGYPTASVQKATAASSPSSWTFLDLSTLSGHAKWVTPTGSQQLYPVNTYANYSFSFETDCPHQPSSMKIAATGIYTLTLNGKKTTFLGTPYSFVHSVTFSEGNFQCGTNRIDIQIANINYSSPLALIYSITQDTTKCYDCQQQSGQSYFDKTTCGCECKSKAKSCSSALKQWLKYPFCRCQCAIPPCPDSYLRDPSSCQCLKPCDSVTPCQIDQVWSDYRCKCVSKCGDIPVSCGQSQIWDPLSCECTCRKKTCPGNQVFNQKSCGCQCPYDKVTCSGLKRWDEVTCQCECPAIKCAAGTYLSDANCECVLSPSMGVTAPAGFTSMNP